MRDKNYPKSAFFERGMFVGDYVDINFLTFGIKQSEQKTWIFFSKVEDFIRTIRDLENITITKHIKPGYYRFRLKYTDSLSWNAQYGDRIVTLLNNKWKSEWGLRSPASLKRSILNILQKDKRFLAKSILAYSYTHYMDETNLLLEHFDKELF